MLSKVFNTAFLGIIALPSAISFPWMASAPGFDGDTFDLHSPLNKRQNAPGCYAESCCPNNPNHPGAAPLVAPFLYLGAKNGLVATKLGNIEVPADNDNPHAFEAPGPLDIRGPCPGLNTMANHHFISHDGITNLAEMLDAQQNCFNVGYDLALTLAVIGIGLTGDPITTKMSIGCDATSRTSAVGSLLGEELGIDAHNKFEADTSLSRSDYFLAQPDDFTFNATLFAMMDKTVQGSFSLPNLVTFMGMRYDQSKATNPHFYFGPKVVLLYGAASFLFRLFPNFVSGNTAPPILEFIGPFFGANQTNTGTTNPEFIFSGGERFPDDWHNRQTPLTLANVAADFITMYSMNPELLGGNVGVNNFDALNTVGISGVTDGSFSGATAQDIICLFYQIATEDLPSSVEGTIGSLSSAVIALAVKYLNPLPVYAGCPLVT